MLSGKVNIIGKRLSSMRIKKNLSYSDICTKLNSIGITMSENDIREIEDNKREVKDFELIAISLALDVSLDYFFKDFV